MLTQVRSTYHARIDPDVRFQDYQLDHQASPSVAVTVCS